MRTDLVFPALSQKIANLILDDPQSATKIIDEQLRQPNLGCATTKQLLDEIAARVNLNYSTVFYEAKVKTEPNTKG